jgi:hypothetical protein
MNSNFIQIILYATLFLLHIILGYLYIHFKKTRYHLLFVNKNLITSFEIFSYESFIAFLTFPLQFLLIIIFGTFGLPVYLNEKNGYPNGFLPVMPFYKKGIIARQHFSAAYLQKLKNKSQDEILRETYPKLYWIIICSGVLAWCGHLFCIVLLSLVQIIRFTSLLSIVIFYRLNETA